MEIKRSCADCGVINCDVCNKTYPVFCPTVHMDKDFKAEVLSVYDEDNNKEIMQAAARVEYEGYCKKTRVEETIDFAKKMGFKKLGIATCAGLISETRALTKILRSHGFEVYGVCCKCGAVPKTTVGIDEECMEIGQNMCNPILQAKTLNKEETHMNIIMGLCVGHDSLFCKYSEAIVTTLVAKDRVLAHNPVGALYTSSSYYSKLSNHKD